MNFETDNLTLIVEEIAMISKKPVIESVNDMENILKKIEEICKNSRQNVVFLLQFVLKNRFPSMFSDKKRKLEENLKILQKNKSNTLAYQKACDNTFSIFEEVIDTVREAIYVVKAFKNCVQNLQACTP